jgi:uncharacterized protein YndB with AHSA1/START domain
MNLTEAETTAVTVQTDVNAPVDHAFRVFTEGIGTWWDPDHHLLDAELVSMTFEPRVGGSIVDRYADGRECRWARVLAYEPSKRVVFSWDITTSWEIETNPDKASEVEVTFVPDGPRLTHVTLTHRNLDRHGAGWQAMRAAVGEGWSLARFAEVARISSSARA